MNSFKKIFGVLLLLTILILPQIVSAEKTDWRDDTYNFRRIKTVVVLNLHNDADLSYVSRAVQMKVDSDYFNNSKKLKCTVLTEEQARRMLGMMNASRGELKRNLAAVADAWIEGNIKTWHDDFYIVPARTVWEDRRRTRRVRDRWGDWYEESYYESVPVTYPPYRVDTSTIISVFEVHDAATGKLIFVREDNRDRDDKDAQKDMFGRMCNSFYEDFAKRIK
ncbi:MAG: hypothetical protein IJS29_09500 [Selenomonadaceae bacterium]|nr:hypothetical protein [Selenomonadaceae bacterium]